MGFDEHLFQTVGQILGFFCSSLPQLGVYPRDAALLFFEAFAGFVAGFDLHLCHLLFAIPFVTLPG